MASSAAGEEDLLRLVEDDQSNDDIRRSAAIALVQAIGRTDVPDLSSSLALMCAVKAR